MSLKTRNTLLLFVTALIWGSAFVAQSLGVAFLEPCTFVGIRMVIGALVLIPVIKVFDLKKPKEQRRKLIPWNDKKLLSGGVACGIVLAVASIFQQYGIEFTTAGKCGFITACYVAIVPLIGILFLKRCYHWLTWVGVGIALLGLYFISLEPGSFEIGKGEILVLICAVFYAVHILIIDHYSSIVDAVRMSFIQFLVAAIVSFLLMVIFEDPQWEMIVAGWKPLLYTGALSCGAGYTIQVVCQKGVEPTVASLVLSLESVFSVLTGWVILHEILNGRELFGCLLMFGAIILVQVAPVGKSRTLK